MYVRTVIMIVVLGLLGIFAIFNWSAFLSPTTLTLGFTTVEAPLGLILLGIAGLLTVLFLVYLVFLQSTTLLESRRQARELQNQREIADRAEVSRFEQLRAAMEARLSELERQATESQAALLARLDEIERGLRNSVEQSGNTLAAYIGEIEDRLERSAGSKS